MTEPFIRCDKCKSLICNECSLEFSREFIHADGLTLCHKCYSEFPCCPCNSDYLPHYKCDKCGKLVCKECKNEYHHEIMCKECFDTKIKETEYEEALCSLKNKYCIK